VWVGGVFGEYRPGGMGGGGMCDRFQTQRRGVHERQWVEIFVTAARTPVQAGAAPRMSWFENTEHLAAPHPPPGRYRCPNWFVGGPEPARMVHRDHRFTGHLACEGDDPRAGRQHLLPGVSPQVHPSMPW
jgi:hypothetical protein